MNIENTIETAYRELEDCRHRIIETNEYTNLYKNIEKIIS